MDRAEKTAFVGDLNEVFQTTAVVVVTHYIGLSVAELTALRGQVRDAGGQFKVTKNRLAKRAIEGTRYEGLAPLFVGPTAIAWADDPVAMAKVATDYAKKNQKLKVIGGGLGSSVIDVAGLTALAKMPPIEELRAKLVGVMKAPMANTLGVLNAPAQKMVGVVNAPAQKLVGVLRAKAQQAEAA